MGKVIVAEGSDSIRSRLAELEAAYGTGGNGRLSALESQTSGWVNVASYSYLVSGGDWTAAIQAAIDACAAAGGGTVEIPGPATNVFLFTSLRVKAGVRLLGLGGVLKLKDNTCADAGTNYYLVHNLVDGGGFYANVTLENLIIDGNKANNTAYTVADGITVGGENVHVRNCWVYDAPDSGVMFSQVKNGSLTGCRIQDGRDSGIYVNDGAGTAAYENRVTGNHVTGFPKGGIALKRISQRTIVAENSIYNCGNGITLENASTSSDYSTNLTIAFNRLRYIGYIDATAAKRGIDLRMCENVICVGNRIEDAEWQAIYVQGARYCTVSHNVISGDAAANVSNGHGIELIDRDSQAVTACVFEGNVITNPKVHGFYLNNTVAVPTSSANVFQGNVVVGAGSNGINGKANFTGNVFRDNVWGGTAADVGWAPTATQNVYVGNTHLNSTGGGILSNSIDWTAAEYRTSGNIRAGAGGATTEVRIGGNGVSAPSIAFGTSGDAVLYRSAANNLRTRDADSFRVGSGAWDAGHLLVGAYHLWADTAGRVRVKSSAPASETDGRALGSQSYISADRGDTNQTLAVVTDAPVQRWATTLTANRTVTLSTTGAANGDTFRVVRTGLGSFTLDVGGLKTIPSATAAYVDVAYNGSAWVLTGYGAL